MTRPLYERRENLEAESEVIRTVARAWRCEAKKLPLAYRLDFAFVRGQKVEAWAEVKCRTYTMQQIDQFGGYMLSLHKWQDAKHLCETTRKPFVLIVRCADGIFFWSGDFACPEVKIGGRTDRADAQDVEPVVLIPASSFKRVAEANAEAAA